MRSSARLAGFTSAWVEAICFAARYQGTQYTSIAFGMRCREAGVRPSMGSVGRMIEAARAVAIPLDRQVLHILPQQFAVDDQEGVREPVGDD